MTQHEELIERIAELKRSNLDRRYENGELTELDYAEAAVEEFLTARANR